MSESDKQASSSTNGSSPAARVKWRLMPRRWHYGYEEGYEHFGSALGEIRKELGFDEEMDEPFEEFANWLYEEGQRLYGTGSDTSVPPVLLEAFEFPALGWEQSMDVIERVAQAVGVSPGTLLDELWLRASGMTEAGERLDD